MKQRNNRTKKIVIATVVIVAIIVFLFIKPPKGKSIFQMALTAQQEAYLKELSNVSRPKFEAFIREAESKGFNIIITSGYRSIQKQNELHAQNPQNAKGGFSFHNFGRAIDINAQKGSLVLRKASSRQDWEGSGLPDIARKHGLSWQYSFGSYIDPVHFQDDSQSITALRNKAIAMYGSVENAKGNLV